MGQAVTTRRRVDRINHFLQIHHEIRDAGTHQQLKDCGVMIIYYLFIIYWDLFYFSRSICICTNRTRSTNGQSIFLVRQAEENIQFSA
jgi:hypothetical protein